MHPKPSDNHVEYRKIPGEAKGLQSKQKEPHQWYWTVRGDWKCKSCWRVKKSNSSQQDYMPCGDVVGSMKKLGKLAQ